MALQTQGTNRSGQFQLREENEDDLNREINFLLDCSVRTVNIDGDKFWLCVPSEHLIELMMTWANSGGYQRTKEEEEFEFFTYEVAEHLDGLGYHRISYLRNDSPQLGAYSPSYGDCSIKDGQARIFCHDQRECFFRPMLVPLTKGGRWDTSFQEAAPDGSIFYGGVLRAMFNKDDNTTVAYFIDGDAELPPAMLKGAAVDLFPNSGGQNPLAWRAFHGLLVCTRNCFKTNLFGVCGMGGLPLLKAEEVRT